MKTSTKPPERHFLLTVQVTLKHHFSGQPKFPQFLVPVKSPHFPRKIQMTQTLNFGLQEGGLDKWMPEVLNDPEASCKVEVLKDSACITHIQEVEERDYLSFREGL